MSPSWSPVSMARTADPHSATAQFFINVAENSTLDFRAPTAEGYGYTPFGRVQFPREAVKNGVLARVAREHGKTPRQVILNCITRRPGMFTIPKAARIEHVEENAGGCGWKLDDDDVAEIDRAFPTYDGPLATL